MPWPYHFVDLTDDQKHHRREVLDRYGVYSQLSALIPILGYQLYRLGAWVYSERQRTKVDYSAVPTSPGLKRARYTTSGVIVRKWRSIVWWLDEEVAPSLGLGLRVHWVVTTAWIIWLLFLCVHKTGDDYLHLTKRCGEIAIAQFPLHYMLAMKSVHSPLALIFKASHEQLNPWHRLNAKAIYTILLLHASLYMNFFIQIGVLPKRLKDSEVIIGIGAFALLTILVSTSLEIVRHWSYRAFFMIHLMIGVWLLPLLFFHATHLRIYVTEALAIFVFDMILRQLDSVKSFATVTSIAHTKLVKLKIPIPGSKLHRFHAAPGQHVYLSLPPQSMPSGAGLKDMLNNPFTVAEVSETDITVVVRTLNGPTKTLSKLTKLTKAKPPINVEGPLGGSKHFPNLIANYDRVLLIAGGVGATFILPVYKVLREQLDAEPRSPDRLNFIWSMRSAAEAHWATDTEESKKVIDEDENLKVYVTRSNADHREHDEEPIPADGSVELDELNGSKEEGIKVNGGRERPDLKKIIDEVFRGGKEERVAVLVCGPKAMAREVRGYVGKWVTKGRMVWFHDEGFGV